MIEDKVREMYDTHENMTHKDIAEALGITHKLALESICGDGVRERDVIQRLKDSWLEEHKDTLTIKEDGSIDSCVQCEMRMINIPTIVPDGWSWEINGRIGDICKACEKDMNAKHTKRMAKLRQIGCIVCKIERGVYTQPEIHHLRDRLGVGHRRNHDRTIPLCPEHHRLGGRGVARHEGLAVWQIRHGKEVELLEMVDNMLEDMLQQ